MDDENYGPNDILVVQETYSPKENEIRWNDNFNGQIHYSHGKPNSDGVLIVFFGSTTDAKCLINMDLINMDEC